MKSSPLDPDFKTKFRKNLATILLDISDLQKTEKDWLSSTNGRGYNEDVCSYFDDLLCGEDLNWAVEKELLKRAEADALLPFHRAFEQLVDEQPKDNAYRDPQIVKSNAWAELAHLAQKAHAAIGTPLHS